MEMINIEFQTHDFEKGEKAIFLKNNEGELVDESFAIFFLANEGGFCRCHRW